jgi:hypothetical protein
MKKILVLFLFIFSNKNLLTLDDHQNKKILKNLILKISYERKEVFI